jgi:MFS family permease
MLEEKPPVSRAAKVMVGILLIFFVFAYLDRTILAMIVDPVRKSLGLDDVQLGSLIGFALASAYAIGGIPFGWLIDRADRRVVLFCGVLFWGLATAGCALVENFQQFFIARMLVGFGESSLMPAAHSLISDSFPRRRLATALSVYTLGSMVGSGVSLILGGAVITLMSHQHELTIPVLGAIDPWRAVFLMVGLPGAALSVLILLIREPSRKVNKHPAPGNVGESMVKFVLRQWPLWLVFTVVFGGMNICNAALVFWQPAYMSRFFHWSAAQYGLALGLSYAVAGSAGLLFSGWAVDRMYAHGIKDAPLRYYLWALILSTPFVLIALLSANVWIYLGLIWIAKFATVNFLGIGSAAVQLSTPTHLRGRMAALFTTVIVSLLGASLGASIPALIARDLLHDEQRMGRAIAVTFIICVPLAVAAILFGMRAFERAVKEAEDLEVSVHLDPALSSVASGS